MSVTDILTHKWVCRRNQDILTVRQNTDENEFNYFCAYALNKYKN